MTFPGESRRGAYGYQRSSRGRGRRVVSSSRGRGREAAASKKWVRPTGDVLPSFVEASETLKQGETDGNNEDSNRQSTQTAASAKSSNVILKGPKHNRYPKLPLHAKSHTWKRPREESESATGNKTVEESKGNVAVPDNDASDESKPAASSVPMVRHGRHKLVSQKSEELVSDGVVPAAQSPERSNAATLAGKTEESRTNTLPMKKRGRNKLVLAKNKGKSTEEMNRFTEHGDSSTHQTGSLGGDNEKVDAGSQHGVLARKGKNKLVLQDAKAVKEKNAEMEKLGPSTVWSTRGSGKGRGRRVASRHGVKRIKLNPSEDDVAEAEGDGGAGSHDETEDPSQATTSEKYTEFAYRQSSTVSQRGRGRGRGLWGRGGAAKGRNMGLVRVEPDAATTRICPSYLRGEPCMNPKCTKRHDVPKEAAIPICSFFQRNGQCNKGDACQFRHVKVNPHATVCPSFSLLGFCENKDCVMKHVRAPKKKPGA